LFLVVREGVEPSTSGL